MGKSNNIRWRKADNELFNKTVRSYNQKITRLQKEFPNMTPQKIDKNQAKSLIKDRKAFNEFIESHSKQGKYIHITNKKGIDLGSANKVRNFEKNMKKSNKNKEDYYKKLEELHIKVQGVEQESTMGDIRARKLEQYNKTKNKTRMRNEKELQYRQQDIDINTIESANDFNKWADNFEKQAKADYFSKKEDVWIENYIKGLKHEFNSNTDDIETLLRETLKKDGGKEKIVDILATDKNAEIGYIYEKSDEGDHENYIRDLWYESLSGFIDDSGT